MLHTLCLFKRPDMLNRVFFPCWYLTAFTSLQWLWRKCNLTIFPLQVYGPFCCHGNQTKRKTGKLLAILNCLYLSNKLESYCFSGFAGVGVNKNSLFKLLFSHGKQTEMPVVIKHINWVDNHQMIMTANLFHITSLVMEKRHFPITSLRELSVALFQNLMLTWQPNKMTTGHKTHKLSRQSSNDHNNQTGFTSLPWLWRKCNLTIFPL